MKRKLAEVREGGNVYVIARRGATVVCSGVMCLGARIETSCRHVRAYQRAVRAGSHLIVRDAGHSLLVRLLDKPDVTSGPEAHALVLAMDILAMGPTGNEQVAARRILAFAEAHGMKRFKTSLPMSGKTRRILVVDQE